MKLTLSNYYIGILLALFLAGCDITESTQDQMQTETTVPKDPMAVAATSEMINFDSDGFKAGAVISEVKSTAGTKVKVYGINSARKGKNAAMIFDSRKPNATDIDLGTPNETFNGPGKGDGGKKGKTYANGAALNNMLVITEDFKTSAPNDHEKGGSLFLTFSDSGPVTLHSLTVLDLEDKESGSNIKLYNNKGDLIKTIDLPVTGDNGRAVVDLQNTINISKVIVNLKGSGAIDNINFTKRKIEDNKPGDGGNNGGTPGNGGNPNNGGSPGSGEQPGPGDGGTNPTPNPPDVACSECKGKVKELTLKYTGLVPNAEVTIMVKTLDNKGEIMRKVIQPNTSFVVSGIVDNNTGFDGSLGQEIKIFINGQLHVSINTSCTLPIGPGLIAGDFLVTKGYSTEGGILCNVDPDQIGMK